MDNIKDKEKSIVEETILPKKRGRKSKKDIELALQHKNINIISSSSNTITNSDNSTNSNVTNSNVTNSNVTNSNVTNNIHVLIEDTLKIETDLNILEDNNENDENDVNDENIIQQNVFLSENLNNNINEVKIVKKRGRKPKGGKIIQQMVQLNNDKEVKPNVILHLKCCLKDLQSNTFVNNDFDSFNFLKHCDAII